MANLFVQPPPLTVPLFPKVCPDSGVPKDLTSNLKRRIAVIRACENNPGLQSAERELCTRNSLYFLNAWVFTESFFYVDASHVSRPRAEKKYPFITWPGQDALVRAIEYSIDNGEPLLVEKSRELGASWLVLMVFLHRFLFAKSPVQFSMISLKELDVDNTAGDVKDYPYGAVSDPATLFGKIDYALRNLPQWMLPPMYRKRLMLVRTDNRSRIDGSASGSFALSSQRRDGVLIDEAAKVDTFSSIWQAITDVAKARLAISTPVGMGTYFSQLRGSGQIKVHEIGWWQDPSKARDLDVEEVPGNRFRYTSSWYRHEVAQRTSQDVAQNLDVLHLESGSTFFNIDVLKTYKEKNCVEPLLRLNIDFRPELTDQEISGKIITKDVSAIRVVAHPEGKWKLWFKPQATPQAKPRDGEFEYAPALGGQIVFGVDVSMGTGASNSAISVFQKIIRAKVAEFADATTPPHVFARIIAAAAIWFGQTVRPLVVPEANGIPGHDLLRQLSRVYRYPNVYTETTVFNKQDKNTTSLGFHSSRPKKAALLGNLARAYALGNFINPSADSIDEAMQYVIYETGQIGPATLMRESEDAKAVHGDRCIADALCLWAGNEQQAYRAEKEQKRLATQTTPQLDLNAKYPNGSAGWRWSMRDKIGLKPGGKKKNLNELKPGDRVSLRDYV